MLKFAKPAQLSTVTEDMIAGIVSEQLKTAAEVQYGKGVSGLYWLKLIDKKGNETAPMITSKNQSRKIDAALVGKTDPQERENIVLALLNDCSIIEGKNSKGEDRLYLGTQGGNSRRVSVADFKAAVAASSIKNVSTVLAF